MEPATPGARCPWCGAELPDEGALSCPSCHSALTLISAEDTLPAGQDLANPFAPPPGAASEPKGAVQPAPFELGEDLSPEAAEAALQTGPELTIPMPTRPADQAPAASAAPGNPLASGPGADDSPFLLQPDVASEPTAPANPFGPPAPAIDFGSAPTEPAAPANPFGPPAPAIDFGSAPTEPAAPANPFGPVSDMPPPPEPTGDRAAGAPRSLASQSLAEELGPPDEDSPFAFHEEQPTPRPQVPQIKVDPQALAQALALGFDLEQSNEPMASDEEFDLSSGPALVAPAAAQTAAPTTPAQASLSFDLGFASGEASPAGAAVPAVAAAAASAPGVAAAASTGPGTAEGAPTAKGKAPKAPKPPRPAGQGPGRGVKIVAPIVAAIIIIGIVIFVFTRSHGASTESNTASPSGTSVSMKAGPGGAGTTSTSATEAQGAPVKIYWRLATQEFLASVGQVSARQLGLPQGHTPSLVKVDVENFGASPVRIRPADFVLQIDGASFTARLSKLPDGLHSKSVGPNNGRQGWLVFDTHGSEISATSVKLLYRGKGSIEVKPSNRSANSGAVPSSVITVAPAGAQPGGYPSGGAAPGYPGGGPAPAYPASPSKMQ